MYGRNNLWNHRRLSIFSPFLNSKEERMEPFQLVRKTLTILGINPNRHAFIDKLLIAFGLFYSSSILSCVFFFIEAETFREYTESIYTLTANIAITFCFTYIIIKMDQLFQYIEDCQRIVYCRKWRL